MLRRLIVGEVSKVSVVITLGTTLYHFFAHLAHYVSPENFAAPELKYD